ncbi:MAG TPA: BamA/TamA family outer membrane protein, partial [Acidobacteriota bacterium]
MKERVRAYATLCFFLIVSLLSSAFAEEPATDLSLYQPAEEKNQINKIHIEAYDCFDPRIPQYRSWPFRFLNKMHNRTNDSFIQNALLVREGDFIDQDILEETERALRRYSFFGDVKIRQEKIGARKVDLYVHTEDQWTTQVDISAGKSAGFSTYQFSLEESNFLGLGKKLGFEYNRNPERTTYDFLFYDPQFLNSRWNFEVGYRTASDGWRYTTDLVRPFYSLDTKWAYGIAWDSGTFTKKLHYKGQTVAEIDTDHRTGLFFLARSWGNRYDKKRFGVLVAADSLLYPHPARIILPEIAEVKPIQSNLHPINREDYQYGAILQFDRQHFIEENYIDNFGRVEDYPSGLLLASTLTHSDDQEPNPDFYQLNSLALFTRQLSPSQYLALQSQFSLRRHTDGDFSNAIFSGYAHYYLQMATFHVGPIRLPRQTVAVNFSTVLTNNVDAPFQISLGEDEGLRGYTFKSFTGQNKILMNLENRIFTPWNYRLLGFGLVGFLDAGYVWSGDENLQFSNFPVSVGIGLRIGLKKAQSARVVRVDLAFPLRKDTSPFATTDQKGYSISISSGQIFSVIENIPKLFQLF